MFFLASIADDERRRPPEGPFWQCCLLLLFFFHFQGEGREGRGQQYKADFVAGGRLRRRLSRMQQQQQQRGKEGRRGGKKVEVKLKSDGSSPPPSPSATAHTSLVSPSPSPFFRQLLLPPSIQPKSCCFCHHRLLLSTLDLLSTLGWGRGSVSLSLIHWVMQIQ